MQPVQQDLVRMRAHTAAGIEIAALGRSVPLAVRELLTRLLRIARREKSTGAGPGEKKGPPHLSNECEKCAWGAKPHQH